MWHVETLHHAGEWINTWTDDDKPLTFRTRAEALDELDDHLQMMQAARIPDDRKNYRVVKITKEGTHEIY
jgi:hypothetical protein